MTKEKKTKNILISTEEVIKKGKYRVFNGTDYDTVHLQTSSDQVIENESKKFVSQSEKDTWNSKAEGDHNHDAIYSKIGTSYTKDETDGLLTGKSDVGHAHAASSVIEDATHRFITDVERSRWNDTYTKVEVDTKISTVSDAVNALDLKNTNEHATITKGYQDADKVIDEKVTTVQGNLDTAVEELTALINSGGSANTELAARVTTIESTTIPEVKNSISSLDSKLSGQVTNLSNDKADKTQVALDIEAAKSALQSNIDLKADKTYTDDQLALKADKSTTYTKVEVDSALDLKADASTMTTELEKKADKTEVTSSLALKADLSDMTDKLALKADATALEQGLAKKAEKVHTHNVSEVTGLGSAATKEVGTASGNIPVLNSLGKLETTILPSIAINETFTAESTTAAMSLPMEIGDVLILQAGARSAVMTLIEEKKAVTYNVPEVKAIQELSEEYITYISNGNMTYLCVNPDGLTFEERFKPLQSVGDVMSAGEVKAALDLKVDKADYNSYKEEVTNSLNLKADKATTYTKGEVDSSLSNKVDKVSGKQLSTNDFTTAYKNKLDGIEEGANKYVHPTGDGNLHVPATNTTNNGKVLMAGSSAGSMSWTKLSTTNIDETTSRKFVTSEQITSWTNKADSNHTHTQYRLISDSYSQTETKNEINKLKTIISSAQPGPGTQIAGAVWIEEIV